MASYSDIAKTPVKKLIFPAIWLALLVWFLNSDARHQIHFPTVSSNASIVETPASSPNVSYNLPVVSEIYDALTSVKKLSSNHSVVTANVSTSSKVAAIIETRASAQIIPLILHFSAVLGPDWPIIIYTTGENAGSFSTSHALLRHINAGRIVVRLLPEGLYFPNWDSVSSFLTTPWLWVDLAPAENLLIFQSDSILCANSVRSVEDFFEWDLIGAPISEGFGQGYNGGLSLRKRSTVLRVLSKYEWAADRRPEDQWYYFRMRDLEQIEKEEGVEDGIKLPSMEIARTFAVETIDYPSPLGLHQPTRFINAEQRMSPLDDWCPEYKLARTDRINE